MGAGVFGLSIAYVCARLGARVRVIEKRALAAGASGGPVGALAPHVPGNWNVKKEFQFASLMMAKPFWREIEQVSGLPSGFGRIGRLQAIPDRRALEFAHARRESARENWRGKAVWEVLPVSEVGDWRPVSATGYVIHDTLSARLQPKLACESLAGAIRDLGGVIEWEEVPATRPVVWATGYEGLQDLSEYFGQTVGCGVKGQAVSLRYDAGEAPQLFAGGLHIVPHADGTVAVGSTSEMEFGLPVSTDSRIDSLLERAIEVYPRLRGAPVMERWAGVRPRARNRAPVLGPWPGRPGQFIANGGFKIGFGMAPKVAEVMADLVLEGRDTVPAGFRVDDCLGFRRR